MESENQPCDKNIQDASVLPRVRLPRLTSLANVRREMGRQYHAHLKGEIGNKVLDVRVRALRAISESFIGDELERRLKNLEERIRA